jgi:hypothetical protein
MSDEIFRVLNLPDEIDSDKITATLENEVIRFMTLRVIPPPMCGENAHALGGDSYAPAS